MQAIHHALVLNLHQPAGNLQELLIHEPWQTHEILYALDRMPRSLWGYEGLARVHLSVSGTLLEALSDPRFQQEVYGVVDCGSLLWHLQNLDLFRILGTGYYHPVLPLTPEVDRDEHLRRWQGIAAHLFWRDDFQGFWPPELGFSMDLIPLLRRFGYRYVIVDSDHVEPLQSMSWQDLRYRPHRACYGDDCITVIVRDRDLSNAQESGMSLDWFVRELQARTRACDFVPLVTTATDGENGGWFRNREPEANFWGIYRSLLDGVRADTHNIRPIFIEDYLDRYGTFGDVTVNTGAWNTGWHHGHGFLQWTGSQVQRDGLARVAQVSQAVHDLRDRAAALQPPDPECDRLLEAALWHVLRAETSCNFFWGEAWVERAHNDLTLGLGFLEQARQYLPD